MNKTGVQLVYLFWMCSMVYCVAADTDNVISEEEKTITLPWPLKDTGHVFRFWCKGRFTRTPADGEFLFKQYLSTDPVDKSNRTDMKVNTDFDLVIGTTQLVDASTYTAVFQPGIGSSSFNYASLVIYKTPTLTFTGLDKNAYNESDPVDVSCKVRDGYPQMHLDNFNINWEGRDFNDKDNTTGSTDKYYSYKIEKQLNLTANDGNVNVTCSVYLTVEGLMLAESRIFTVSSPRIDGFDSGLEDWEIALIVIGTTLLVVIIVAGVIKIIIIHKKKRSMKNVNQPSRDLANEPSPRYEDRQQDRTSVNSQTQKTSYESTNSDVNKSSDRLQKEDHRDNFRLERVNTVQPCE